VTATPPFTVPRWVRLAVRAVALGWIVFFWVFLQTAQAGFVETDAQAYWGFSFDELYRGVQLGDQGAFLYSPLVAWLFAPFSWMPYEVFYALLTAVSLVALVWMLGPELGALALLLQPVSNEVARGNIHLLMAAAIVIGLRYPAAWAWVLLTKVTPGIGLLWFAFRREWRALLTAVAWTGALVAVSFVVAPDLWIRWLAFLADNAEATRPSVLEIGVLPRIALAVAVLALGAWRSQPAIVPVAAMLALPAIWVNSLAMLVAVVPLWRGRLGPSAHTDGARTHLD
jgi:hypothetical protein